MGVAIALRDAWLFEQADDKSGRAASAYKRHKGRYDDNRTASAASVRGCDVHRASEDQAACDTGTDLQPHRNDIPFGRWVEMDIDYILHRNLAMDISIVFKTILAMIRKDGE